MNYYVLNSNDEIELFDTDKKRLQTTLKFKPELADEKIHQTTKEIVELDGHFVFANKHQEEIAEKEQIATDEQTQAEMQAQLAMVKADIETATLLDNSDWLKELKTAYSKLINNNGKTKYVYTRTRCPYCGSEKLTGKYGQSWCENCEAGKLDLQLYEETHEVDEETKDDDEEVNEK